MYLVRWGEFIGFGGVGLRVNSFGVGGLFVFSSVVGGGDVWASNVVVSGVLVRVLLWVLGGRLGEVGL